MPHHQAQKKSLRQDAKRYERNRSGKSRLRTLEKKLRTLLAQGDSEAAAAQLKVVQKALDQAKSRGILKPDTVSRKKSRLTKHVNGLTAS